MERLGRTELPAGRQTFSGRAVSKPALAAMNLRDLLAKVPKGVMEIGYFATVEEARAWLATPTA